MRVSHSVIKGAGFVSLPHQAEFCVFPGTVTGRLGVFALILVWLLGVFAPWQVQAQNVTLAPVITTVAGGGNGCTGQTDSVGDGCAAISAELYSPNSVAVDIAGNLYIADTYNNRIRVVNMQATSITVAGVTILPADIATVAGSAAGGSICTTGETDSLGDGCPATSAELNTPSGVAVDSAGNLYIADTNNQRIRKVDTSGMITTFAGGGTVCVSNTDPVGDGCPATSAQLNYPTGLAVDRAGNLYIADCYNYRIRVVNTQASQITVLAVTIGAGNIATVAGTGTYGYNGDNIAATSAELWNANGVAVDNSGNLYIADFDNLRIREVNTSGVITTVAGNGTPGYSGDGGPATSANLGNPNGVAVDSAGDLYIADSDDVIRKVGTNGIISTLAGGGTGCALEIDLVGDGCPATSAELNYPFGVAVDSEGNLYIADYDSSRVRKVSKGSVIFGQVNLGANSTQNAFLSINTALTLSSVAASGDYSVGTNSCVSTFPAPTICTVPVTFTPAQPGQRWFPLLVTDNGSNKYSFGLEGTGVGPALAFTPGIISSVAGNGTLGYNGDKIAAIGAWLAIPAGVALDSAGNLYIADQNNQRIRKVDVSGTITTVAGGGSGCTGQSNPLGDGCLATSAILDAPLGVTVDSSGNLYVADGNNSRIRKVDASGVITTVAGNGTPGYGGDGNAATSAKINYPSGVAVDSAGNLYIADEGNNVVRKVDTDGIITTAAGNGYGAGSGSTGGYGGDGGPATSAELYHPSGVTVDSAGNLYIGDYDNERVRKVLVSGTITTVAGKGTAGYSGDAGPATSAELTYPSGMAVDGAGNLYIGDSGNNCIRKVDTNGNITTVAGNGYGANSGGAIGGSSGDYGPATSAELYSPLGVAVDSAGNIYFADADNNRVRKVDVTTSALSFGSVVADQTSSAQSVAVSDVGNAELSFTSFAFSPNAPFQFTGNGCATGTPLGVGATCLLGVAFAPTTQGSALSTLSVADNAFNSPQTVTLSGNGIALTPTFSNLTPSQTIPPLTSSITLSGTISAGSNYPPSGETVSVFISDGTHSLLVSATIGMNGNFSVGLNPIVLPVGTYTITYSYGGDSNFISASDSSTSLTVSSTATYYILSLNELGNGQGVVTDNFGRINCGENNGIPSSGNVCSASYASGTQVRLTENAGLGTTFGGWGNACALFGTENACSLNMNSALNASANFVAPATSITLSFSPGKNVAQMYTFACPDNPNPTPANPCPDPNAHALQVVIPQVSSAFQLTVKATEFQADGLCPQGGTVTSDFDCRIASFYSYGSDTNNNTITPICYPYANGNCVHYELAQPDGTEPPTTAYSGGVFWKVTFNNGSFTPPGPYWNGTGNTPRMLDDPDVDEVPPPVGPLPYGTNCSTPMMVGTPPTQYPGPIYCQFDNDITTFFNATEGVDPGIGGRTKQANDVVVAFLPTTPGNSPVQQPPLNSAPTMITGSCVSGCVSSGNSFTFTQGTGGTFTVTATGYPAPTLTESGTLPSGLTFDATTGLITGAPAAGTAGYYSIEFTASNVAGSTTQAFSLTVSGLEISTTGVNFGTLYLGQIAARPVTLTNTGTMPITISKINVTGPGNALGDYGDISLCAPLFSSLPGTLPAGKSCKIFVGTFAAMKIFSPTASTATLAITDSTPGSPHLVPLTAQVINPVPTFSTYKLTFPVQTVGTTSGARTVTLTNTGNTPLTLGTLSVSGNFALAAGTSCATGVTLGTGDSCAITVTFTPSAKGARSGSIKVTDNALISPQIILLTGTGS